jgi:hypothetical protein
MNYQPKSNPASLLKSAIALILSRSAWRLAVTLLGLLFAAGAVPAQTTTFTYQGRFNDGGTAANGTYDMQFKLFDNATVGSGSQLGSTITNGAVNVSNGVFTVQLDFGAAAFPGANRFVEIGVRLAGASDPYTVLSPRQQLTSTPYAIRAGTSTTADSATSALIATNANQLAGVAASQYVLTGDSRLSDPRTPTAGSAFYIQNTNSQQAANFNISGNGTAGGTLSGNTVNVTTQYNFGNSRVLGVSGGTLFPNSNTFVGMGAGTSNSPGNSGTAGNLNSFFGSKAGNANNGGGGNSFFGAGAGQANVSGSGNAFFGDSAGIATLGSLNSFFGSLAGQSNNNGSENSFFGRSNGANNTTGSGNSFFGSHGGDNNQSGNNNAFFGQYAGSSNQTGNNNTIIGSDADVGGNNLTNATAIGSNAVVNTSNSLVLGNNANVGIGTSSPIARLHLVVNGGNVLLGNAGCSSGFVGIGFGSSLTGCANYSLLGNGTDTMINRPTGGTIQFRENNNTQMMIAANGAVSITTLGSAGSTSLCRNASNQISTCSSSLRYKTNIHPFMSGLSVLNRLRPITFDWKDGGMHDLGFGAEDIAAVEPLLVTHNSKGEVEGVKYDRITAVLVNAVKEQQEQIKRQQNEIESLKQLVCSRNRRAPACK